MLVLSRKVNESIDIDGVIVVRVLRLERDGVRLGIEADRAIPVFRSEICKKRPARGPAARPRRRKAVAAC